MHGRTRTRRARSGFTLLEAVLVLIVTAILAGAVSAFLVRPVEGYRDLRRRARLIDAAENTLRRMARDVRRAVPNSVRVGAGGLALELLHVAEGTEYRSQPGSGHTLPSDWLSFAVPGDDQWNALGSFRSLVFSYGTPLPGGTRIAVYPTDAATLYTDAATGANPGAVTPAATSITILAAGDEDRVLLSAPHRFRFASPARRFYVVDEPVSYLCDPGAGLLTRYAAYAPTAAQPVNPAAPPLAAAASAVAARHVAGCVFTYQPGTPWRAGLVTLELSVAEAGEQVRLLHQIHVENAP